MDEDGGQAVMMMAQANQVLENRELETEKGIYNFRKEFLELCACKPEYFYEQKDKVLRSVGVFFADMRGSLVPVLEKVYDIRVQEEATGRHSVSLKALQYLLNFDRMSSIDSF